MNALPSTAPIALRSPPALACGPDWSVVQRAVAGSEAAFREIVESHQAAVYRYLLKHAISMSEAEELTQDVFLQAYVGLARFNGHARLRTWLIGIALNLVKNLINRSPMRLAHARSDEDVGGDLCSWAVDGCHDCAPDPASDVAYRRALFELDRRIDELPADSRECLTLIALEGLSYEEVATLTGEPVGSIKSRVCRARKTLLRKVSKDNLAVLSSQAV